MSSSDANIVGAMIALLGGFLIIFVILAILSYVFTSIALYTMAKNRNIDNAWLAWIPVASGYIMGKIIYEKVSFGSFQIPYAQILLFVLPLISGILTGMAEPGSGFATFVYIISVISSVYYFVALFRVFKLYKYDSRILYIVLSIIFTLLPLAAFFLYGMRNNEPVEYLNDSNSDSDVI